MYPACPSQRWQYGRGSIGDLHISDRRKVPTPTPPMVGRLFMRDAENGSLPHFRPRSRRLKSQSEELGRLAGQLNFFTTLRHCQTDGEVTGRGGQGRAGRGEVGLEVEWKEHGTQTEKKEKKGKWKGKEVKERG
ncbi:hypothetical protein E2C01_038104 [Portunus trituberculatus]|uniref:Uncharacterized protein n=1 Tax=Portunus trituberculatus TaxID=210409 RepID=A0A5B7FBB6_PORTR|nr:hypothetical protein [Portunus trituberculatus]